MFQQIYKSSFHVIFIFILQDIIQTQEQNMFLQEELRLYKKNTDEQLQYLKVTVVCNSSSLGASPCNLRRTEESILPSKESSYCRSYMRENLPLRSSIFQQLA